MNGNLAYQQEMCEELIGGRLVAMAPASTPHNRIAFNIAILFGNYLKGKECVPFGDGEAVFLTRTDHFIPDSMIVCDRGKIKFNGVHGAPDLVVEVLSPRTAKNDKGHKKDVYEQCGVREYWIISPEEKSITIYLLREGRFVLDNVYTLYPDRVLETMTGEEKAALVTQFKCSLFEDLTISLYDIFSDTF